MNQNVKRTRLLYQSVMVRCDNRHWLAARGGSARRKAGFGGLRGSTPGCSDGASRRPGRA